MVRRRLLAIVLAVSTLVGSTSVSALANSRTENFFVYMNGGSVVSSGAAKKTEYGSMYTYTKERPGSTITWVQGVETVNLRGRNVGTATKATVLGETSYRGSTYLGYLSGCGKMNHYYKLAVQYASDNPYEKLDLECLWRP